MSVTQIKDEILHLSTADRHEVEEFLREVAKKEEAAASPAAEKPRREKFEEAKAHLFNHYGDLLEKLA